MPSLPQPFRLWDATATLVDNGGTLELTAPTPPDVPCQALEEHAVVCQDASGYTVWRQAPGPIDARVLEDFSGQASVRANYSSEGFGPLRSLRLSTAPVPFAGSAGAPPSRGAACTLGTVARAGGDCPLTDGLWAQEYVSEGKVSVDLGDASELSLIVLRGHFEAAQVAVSTDGQAWTTLRDAISENSVAIAPPAGTTARYVQLLEPFDDQAQYQPMLSVSELSVW